MNVRACFHRNGAGTMAVALMLGLLAGCAQDDTTSPDQGSGKIENLPSDLGAVHTADVAHYADGYVWAYNPTAPSYTAGGSYSFNRAGKAITITRSGTGSYKVRFAGLSALLGTKSTVHVTGYYSDDSFCKPVSQKLASDVVQVKCFDASSGSPVDAYYTVYITKSYAHLAFAFANLPTGNNYAPLASASFNPTGAMRVFHLGVGVYQVQFKGFSSKTSSNGGDVQVNAIGSGAQHCESAGWGNSGQDLVTIVNCYSRTGDPKDAKFNVLVITPKAHLAYAFANQPTLASYTPEAFFSSNPSGGAVTITRSNKGFYTVKFNGFSPALLDGGGVQVTGFAGGNVQCKVSGWDYSSGSVSIFCFTPSGAEDADFDVMFFS